ncbi:MAG: histidinol dehydrogenase [Terriglobales bacterium]
MRILTGRAAESKVTELSSRGSQLSKVEGKVKQIVADVQRRGDVGLRNYAEKWDGLASEQSLRVTQTEVDEAWRTAAPELKSALREGRNNIAQFCKWQMPREWTRRRKGLSLGQLVRPLESVGCYVPGGRYPLVSTLLMTVIPAQTAGVKNIRVVSPRPAAEVLAAAGMLGVTEFYRVGGAQAIAALAYGTESIPGVDKIVGPGNLYVTAAKKLVSFDCAIDFLAGPTEIVILSDSGNPGFIAADLVAQAEHDPEALAVFITTSHEMADSVKSSVRQLVLRHAIARESINRSGAILVANSVRQALEWANRIAPEHITVCRKDVPFIQNAGSIFIGNYSAQAAGDYAAGPNHVLPTAGVARFRGGLSVMDFVKLISVQELSRSGLERLSASIEYLAETEGLKAHAQSIRVRVAHA